MGVQPVRRYREAFKMQVISELESGKLGSQCEAQRKYGIQGNGASPKWLRKYGKHQLIPGVQTVIKPDENERLKQLEQENRRPPRRGAPSGLVQVGLPARRHPGRGGVQKNTKASCCAKPPSAGARAGGGPVRPIHF